MLHESIFEQSQHPSPSCYSFAALVLVRLEAFGGTLSSLFTAPFWLVCDVTCISPQQRLVNFQDLNATVSIQRRLGLLDFQSLSYFSSGGVALTFQSEMLSHVKECWCSSQCFPMAVRVDLLMLECSLILASSALAVSPIYAESQSPHCTWYTTPHFWLLRAMSLGCTKMDQRVLIGL